MPNDFRLFLKIWVYFQAYKSFYFWNWGRGICMTTKVRWVFPDHLKGHSSDWTQTLLSWCHYIEWLLWMHTFFCWHSLTLSFFIKFVSWASSSNIYIDHLSRHEKKKCSPWKVDELTTLKPQYFRAGEALEAQTWGCLKIKSAQKWPSLIF